EEESRQSHGGQESMSNHAKCAAWRGVVIAVSDETPRRPAACRTVLRDDKIAAAGVAALLELPVA
ncbi:MAG: hypothetical protein ACXVJT_04670, partial [Thermoanaerobaculia bacterium]